MSTYEALILKGKEIGIKEGREETIKETVLRMDKNGFDISSISIALNISKDEVEEMLQSEK